jgi:hypothetical protein
LGKEEQEDAICEPIYTKMGRVSPAIPKRQDQGVLRIVRILNDDQFGEALTDRGKKLF